jgi:CRISPR-associated endoribonuclease Cas6
VHFSASDPVFLIHVYNGLVQLRKDYPLFPGLKARVERFNLEQQKQFQCGEMLFKTCSPIIVRDTNNSGRSSRYITSASEVFEDKLYHSVRSMSKVLLDDAPELWRDDFSAEFTNFKTVRISHYTKKGAPRDGRRELIEATAGTIRIKAPAPVLQLIYDAGVGAKRSQGFGMLGIV